MKRIHFLLLGLLVSLCIAAVSPSLPPTRIAPGSNITIVTNGVNSFTIASSVTNYGQSFTNITAYGSSSNAITIPGTNSLGIGNAGPALAPIHVGDYTANSSIGSKILVSENVDNTTPGVNGHAFSDSSLLARSGGIGYNSYDARINIGGGADYDHYAAFQSAPVSVAVGLMKDYYAHYDQMQITSGMVSNDYGFYKASTINIGSGVFANIYGVYIKEQTLGTNSNYGIYTQGTTPSYFGGNIIFGSGLKATNALFYGQTNYGTIYPAADGTYNIGVAGNRHFNIYAYNGRFSSIFGSGLNIYTIKEGTAATTLFTLSTTSAQAETNLTVKVGGAATYARVGGMLKVDTTQTGNVGAGVDVLQTYSIPAKSLAVNGDGLSFRCAGTFGASLNTKAITVTYGGTTVLDTGALAITAAGSWVITGTITRTGASTQKCEATISTSDALLLTTVNYTAAAETLSGAVVLAVTGEGTDDNDIVKEIFRLNYDPAP